MSMSISTSSFEGEYFDETQVVRSPWSRLRLQTVIEGESMTVQSEKDLTDINNIVARFDRTGELPPGRGPGEYLDVTMLNGDLLEVMERSQEIIDKATVYFEGVEAEEAAEAAKLAEENADILARAKAMVAAANSPTDQLSFGGSGGTPV